MKPIIRIRELCKRYRLGGGGRRGAYQTLGEALAGLARRPWRSAQRLPDEELWALRGVECDILPGEVVGVIGRNGAGKSTLLKILARITEPTAGRVELYGQVGSLLEVGTGFHPELTGAENVYLNGAIIGLKREQIRARFDNIVAFAELEKFMDTPVKRYSSGMYMRLAFAVAAHLEPDILLIDEVLAVGDARFQERCLGKINEVAQQGRTVLFVSHNLAAVGGLCRRAVVLERGRVEFSGPTQEAIARYLAQGPPAATLLEREDRVGSGAIRVVAVELRDAATGRPLAAAASGQDVDLWLCYEKDAAFQSAQLNVGILVKTQWDTPVFLQHNRLSHTVWGALPARGAFVCRIPRLPLPPASYRLTYSVMRHEEYLDGLPDAFTLNVVDGDFFGAGEVPPATHGCALVAAQWRLETESVRALL